jgi:hypothetical protein
MKKNRYITPETEVVTLHLMGTVMGEGLDDLFGGESESDEDNQSGWAGAKEYGGLFDEEPFGDLWEEPVEDPFAIGD